MFYWKDKDKTTTTEEAVEAIADFLSSSDGIRKAVRGELSEVDEFANKWDVPFDRGLVSKMVKFQESKRYGGDGALLEEKGEEEMFEDFRSEHFEDIKKEYGEKVASASWENVEEEYGEVYDWFCDWKYDTFESGHIWQSSSELC